MTSPARGGPDTAGMQLVAALRRVHRPSARDRTLCAGCLTYLPCPTLVHVDRFADALAAAAQPADGRTGE